MTVGGAYVRVYYAILDDPKFETVYEDDRHLAAWLRLLIVADQTWPGYPPIPAQTRTASFKALLAVGLVDAMPKHCYRIHGLDAERMKRSQSARNAAASRWQSASNAPASESQSGRNASHTRTESESESESPSLRSGIADKPRPPSERQRVVSWLTSHGLTRPTGYVLTDLTAVVKGTSADAVIASFEEALALRSAVTTKNYVNWAEKALTPNHSRNGATPPAGHHGNAKEIADAFRA